MENELFTCGFDVTFIENIRNKLQKKRNWAMLVHCLYCIREVFQYCFWGNRVMDVSARFCASCDNVFAFDIADKNLSKRFGKISMSTPSTYLMFSGRALKSIGPLNTKLLQNWARILDKEDETPCIVQCHQIRGML